MLPVHRDWILLLGLVDRYAKREDLGLFRDESRNLNEHLDFEIREHFGSDALYGLSGVMRFNPPDSFEQRNEEDVKPGALYFHLHNTSHMRQINTWTTINDISP